MPWLWRKPAEQHGQADVVSMTRAERREAREAEAAGIWPVPAPQSDPEAERIATAAEYRDEVVTADPLTEDIAIPANEWAACTRPSPGRVRRAGACGRAKPELEPVVEPEPEPGAGAWRSSRSPEPTGRRISALFELRDGGFGVGSAAPIEDGAQPLDHPVQAYRDTMTFREPGVPGYDSAEPDVWFYDASAAERSGFRPADG